MLREAAGDSFEEQKYAWTASAAIHISRKGSSPKTNSLSGANLDKRCAFYFFSFGLICCLTVIVFDCFLYFDISKITITIRLPEMYGE